MHTIYSPSQGRWVLVRRHWRHRRLPGPATWRTLGHRRGRLDRLTTTAAPDSRCRSRGAPPWDLPACWRPEPCIQGCCRLRTSRLQTMLVVVARVLLFASPPRLRRGAIEAAVLLLLASVDLHHERAENWRGEGGRPEVEGRGDGRQAGELAMRCCRCSVF